MISASTQSKSIMQPRTQHKVSTPWVHRCEIRELTDRSVTVIDCCNKSLVEMVSKRILQTCTCHSATYNYSQCYRQQRHSSNPGNVFIPSTGFWVLCLTWVTLGNKPGKKTENYHCRYRVQPVIDGTPVKNWTILLEQSFTARMPLLTATSAFGLGDNARVLNGVTCTVSVASWKSWERDKFATSNSLLDVDCYVLELYSTQ